MSRPTVTTNITEKKGFTQNDVNSFLRQGFTAAGRKGPEVNNTPTQKTFSTSTTTTSGGLGGFGGAIGGATLGAVSGGAGALVGSSIGQTFNGSNTTDTQNIAADQLSNLNQSQVDAFVNAFATRAQNIRQRRRQPGRSQNIFTL